MKKAVMICNHRNQLIINDPIMYCFLNCHFSSFNSRICVRGSDMPTLYYLSKLKTTPLI